LLFRRRSERLVKLPEFEMWVSTRDRGISKGLIERAERFARGQDPGPEREPEFNWIVREEIRAVCEHYRNREGRAVIYDLGANLGFNSLIIDAVCRSLLPRNKYMLYAIEPNPDNVPLLRKNLDHGRLNAELCQCAIADYTGEGQFQSSDHSNLGTLAGRGHASVAARKVKVFSLPDFAETFATGIPNFIKMDIEGGEVEVLKGARQFLADCPPPCKIIMEVHPPAYTPERSLKKELRFLFERGWAGKYLVSAAVALPDRFREAGLTPFLEFHTGRHARGIFRDFTVEQFLDFSCHSHLQEIPGRKPSPKIVRAILIEKR